MSRFGDDDMEDEDMELEEPTAWDHAEGPDSMKNLRACIPCMLVKTYEQFVTQGCENCQALGLQDDEDRVKAFTTPSFEGLMALTQPKQSWVAKWQFLNVSGEEDSAFLPGVYALKIKGDIPEGLEAELQEAGLRNVGKIIQEQDRMAQELKKGVSSSSSSQAVR